MTNQQAIKTVEDIGFYVPLFDEKVIYDAKNWNEMVNNYYQTNKFENGGIKIDENRI